MIVLRNLYLESVSLIRQPFIRLVRWSERRSRRARARPGPVDEPAGGVVEHLVEPDTDCDRPPPGPVVNVLDRDGREADDVQRAAGLRGPLKYRNKLVPVAVRSSARRGSGLRSGWRRRRDRRRQAWSICAGVAMSMPHAPRTLGLHDGELVVDVARRRARELLERHQRAGGTVPGAAGDSRTRSASSSVESVLSERVERPRARCALKRPDPSRATGGVARGGRAAGIQGDRRDLTERRSASRLSPARRP